MRKLLLFVGFGLMTLMASAQNPFAYGLKASAVNDGSVTFTYSLNAPAQMDLPTLMYWVQKTSRPVNIRSLFQLRDLLLMWNTLGQ